ncbi:hypothetical protein LCGC14_3023700, partial [marine sediment metagenome]
IADGEQLRASEALWASESIILDTAAKTSDDFLTNRGLALAQSQIKQMADAANATDEILKIQTSYQDRALTFMEQWELEVTELNFQAATERLRQAEGAADEVAALAVKEADRLAQIDELASLRKIAAIRAVHEARLALERRIAPSSILPGKPPRSLAVLQGLIESAENQIRAARFSVDPSTGLPNVYVGQSVLDLLARLKAEALQWYGPGFQHGGVVPGPLGAPQMAMVHGGETITPPGKTGGMTLNLTVQGDVLGIDDLQETVLSWVRRAVTGGGFAGVLERA